MLLFTINHVRNNDDTNHGKNKGLKIKETLSNILTSRKTKNDDLVLFLSINLMTI